MMTYEVFKEYITEKILDFLPDEFKNCEVKLEAINKTNQILDGLKLVLPSDTECNAYPIVYLNRMYEEYSTGKSVQELMESFVRDMQNTYQTITDNISNFGFSDEEDKIVLMLINTEQNMELLEEIPHREFMDLSIVYRYVLTVQESRLQSVLINNDHAEYLGMTEDQLYEAAIRNTKKILPIEIRSMNEIIQGFFTEAGISEENAELMVEETAQGKDMYVISNVQKINGAASMVYEDTLHELAEKIGGDLYVLPSSIHEVIAVSAELGEPEELAQMVTDINMESVPLEIRLSNQVYHYDKDLRKLALATDTPNKRLDGIVAESQMTYAADMRR
ncbi:MAG: DUF5688 family protein [Clostridium sp.]|nr:DUF5688 family protein [Clostridium sp.]MCM1550070.1 DUF5688 family protein [Clostridium sp.]